MHVVKNYQICSKNHALKSGRFLETDRTHCDKATGFTETLFMMFENFEMYLNQQ